MMQFNVTVSTDNNTGELLAVYFKFRTGKTHVTKELAGGKLMADYNRTGKLLGIEMLAPCSVQVLDQIDVEAPAKAFVKNAVPHAFMAGRFPKPEVLAIC